MHILAGIGKGNDGMQHWQPRNILPSSSSKTTSGPRGPGRSLTRAGRKRRGLLRDPGPVILAVHHTQGLQLIMPLHGPLTLSWGSFPKAPCRASATPGQGCLRLLHAPITACCTSLLLCTWSALATAVAHMTSCSTYACSLVDTYVCSTSVLEPEIVPVLQSLAALPGGS